MSTTRFSSKPKSSAPLLCKWSGCEAYENGTEFENVEELARHVRITHVEPFQSQDVVVCQWEKCKVYNVPSSSIQWLQRHVQQAHTKDRPFKCIMNGCIKSFNSREALQRHVQRHLEPSVTPGNTPQSPSNKRGQRQLVATGKTSQSNNSSSPFVLPSYHPSLYHMYTEHSTPAHHFDVHSDSSYDSSEDSGKRVGRKKPLCLKIRIPRRSISLSSPLQCPTPYNGAHIHTDVWDHKMMSVVRQACHKLTRDSMGSTNLCIKLKASILGQRRCAESAEDELLVRWSPQLADDCWVPVSQFSPQKSILLSQLSQPYLSLLMSHCFPFLPKTRNSHRRQKQ